MEGQGYIYKIEFKDGSIYIGQTKNFEARMQRYRDLDCVSQSLLYRKLKKHGLDSTSHIIISVCNTESLDSEELKYIKLYNSAVRYNPKGLNILMEEYSEYLKIKHLLPKRQKPRVERKVQQIDPQGIVVKIWNSPQHIAAYYKIAYKTIIRHIIRKTYLRGHHWKYEHNKKETK